MEDKPLGTIVWTDLTVGDAETRARRARELGGAVVDGPRDGLAPLLRHP